MINLLGINGLETGAIELANGEPGYVRHGYEPTNILLSLRLHPARGPSPTSEL
jgi:hypothetical protein